VNRALEREALSLWTVRRIVRATRPVGRVGFANCALLGRPGRFRGNGGGEGMALGLEEDVGGDWGVVGGFDSRGRGENEVKDVGEKESRNGEIGDIEDEESKISVSEFDSGDGSGKVVQSINSKGNPSEWGLSVLICESRYP
jgi:hypothetical protein